MLYALAILMAHQLGGAGPPPPRHIYVERRTFDCFLGRAAGARRARYDPILVDLTDCPPQFRRPLRGSFPAWSGPRSPDGVDRILVLTRAQLGCLAARRASAVRPWQPVDSRRYRLTLDMCSR